MIDKDMLMAFHEESNGILTELKAVVSQLEDADEDTFPAPLFQDFAQKIDRIMGAAKTMAVEDPEHLGLKWLGALAELCKFIGYKTAELKQTPLVPIVTAFWSDVLDVSDEFLSALENPAHSKKIAEKFAPTLQKRLEWLKTRIAPQGSGGGLPPSQASKQADIDQMLSDFLK